MASVDADTTPRDLTVRRQYGRIAAVAAVVIALDQLTKWWAVEVLSDRTIEIVWTLQLRLIRNFGASFSLADGRGALIGVVAVAVVVLLVRTARVPRPPAAVVAIGLLAGGAIGNVIDRLFRSGDGFLGGGVVDFVDFQWFPVFNVADMAVTFGILVMLITGLDEPDAARGD